VRYLALLSCLTALLAAAPGASAAKRTRDVPRHGEAEPRAFPDRAFRDRVIGGKKGAARVARARARISATTGYYRTPDGYTVEVVVSAAYVPDPASDQAYVDYLYGLLHNFELGRIKLFIGSPAEIQGICGAESVACYVSREDRMYVAGEDFAGSTVEEAVSHEYGHHLASWRANDPWDPIDWGPKRWASREWVCSGVQNDLFAPGDQGARYADDPGESFAEAYSFLNTYERPWAYNDLLQPDAASYAAIRRDVLRPWTRRKTKRFKGRLSRKRRKRRFRVRIRLDGDISVRLRGPRRSNFNLEIRSGRQLIARTRRRRSRDRLTVNWCRDRGATSERATVVVKRKRGRGRFKLRVRYPG